MFSINYFVFVEPVFSVLGALMLLFGTVRISPLVFLIRDYFWIQKCMWDCNLLGKMVNINIVKYFVGKRYLKFHKRDFFYSDFFTHHNSSTVWCTCWIGWMALRPSIFLFIYVWYVWVAAWKLHVDLTTLSQNSSELAHGPLFHGIRALFST